MSVFCSHADGQPFASHDDTLAAELNMWRTDCCFEAHRARVELMLFAEGLRNTLSYARFCFDHAVSRIGSVVGEYFNDEFQASSVVLAMVDHNI